jgi:hypothetical protein
MYRNLLITVSRHLSVKALVRSLIAVVTLGPLTVNAAGLTNRTDLVGSSQASATTAHQLSFSTATASNVGSIGFVFCTTATGACTLPAGLATTSATLTAQSGATGFSVVATTNGAPYITRGAAAVGASVALSYTLSGLVSPSATNQTYYVRITTYSGSDGITGPVDSGQIADSTAMPIQLTGVTPPILVFCVGTSITSDCTSVTGSTIDFGDFSPTSTNAGTSVMQAQTNAANGYTITVNGTTLSSGANTIPAMSGTTVTPGVGQFGLNLRTNSSPSGGADVSGSGSGTPTGNYGIINTFRFGSGDPVASAPAPTNANTFTSHYVVDIGGAQAAGVYTATMTYICTASF